MASVAIALSTSVVRLTHASIVSFVTLILSQLDGMSFIRNMLAVSCTT